MPKRRESIFVIILVVGLVASTLILAEIVLRVYAGSSEGQLAAELRADPYAVLVEPHGEAGYRPRSNRVMRYGNGTVANINDLGYRGPEVRVPKPAGTVRILLLGGSTTFGWGVDDDETIGAHLQRMLEERHPEVDTEVVNLAYDGYDSYQLLERMRTDGVALEPDVVVVNSGVNDVRNAWYQNLVDGDPRTLLWQAQMARLREEEVRGGPTMWTRTKHYLYLARFPGRLVSLRRESTARQLGGSERAEPHTDALDYFRRNVERIVELSGNAGARLVLLSTPPSALNVVERPDTIPRRSYWLGNAAATQAYRDSLTNRLRDIATRHSAPGLEVESVPHAPFPELLFLDDAHLKPEGNRQVAEEFILALETYFGPLRAR